MRCKIHHWNKTIFVMPAHESNCRTKKGAPLPDGNLPWLKYSLEVFILFCSYMFEFNLKNIYLPVNPNNWEDAKMWTEPNRRFKLSTSLFQRKRTIIHFFMLKNCIRNLPLMQFAYLLLQIVEQISITWCTYERPFHLSRVSLLFVGERWLCMLVTRRK